MVACSGGADSLALLAATVFEATEPSWQVIGATVDHGLQAGSAEHADRVAEQMRSLGVAESVTARVKVEAPGLGPEAAAREARYAVLAEIAERFSARVVLLGHTLDDQAETVLLGLTRGSGGRALSGMRRAFEVYRRPLLDVTRADTETACLAEGIEFWTDPHNADQEFTRVRVRTRCCRCSRRSSAPEWPPPSRARPICCERTRSTSTRWRMQRWTRCGWTESRSTSLSLRWNSFPARSAAGCSGSPP